MKNKKYYYAVFFEIDNGGFSFSGIPQQELKAIFTSGIKANNFLQKLKRENPDNMNCFKIRSGILNYISKFKD